MILITSSGEFFFYHFTVSFFFVHFTIKKKKSRIVFLLSCACPVLTAGVHVSMGFNCDQMEPPYEEHYSQYPVERIPNSYRSMRDYRNPLWVSSPSYMVPPTNSPYGNTYNPSWGNHPNSSWELRPPQYTPPAPPYYASTP